jgi:hypothetical protein
MKRILLLSISLITLSLRSLAQTVTFSAAKRLVEPVFERVVKPENIIEIKSAVKQVPNSDPKIKDDPKPDYLWTISGVKGKDWEFEKGSTETSPSIKLTFNKLGNYTVNLTVILNKDKDDENEISYELEDYLTVRSVFPELAALYAQKPKPNFKKLVERAADYIVKPKYANDPTPYLFLAKGYLGLVQEGNSDPEFEGALEECVSSFATAKEMDKNGVLNDVEHQNFINDLEMLLLKEYLEVQIEGDMSELAEAIDFYSQITLNPICIKYLDAYQKYKTKNAKGANLIWTAEIPKLLKYERGENDEKYNNSFKNELGEWVQFTEADIIVLKYGVMYSAIALKELKNLKACEILKKVDPWFQFEKDFRDLFEGSDFNSCVIK